MPRFFLALACALVPLGSRAADRSVTRPEVVRQALARSVRVQLFSNGQLVRSGSGVVVRSSAPAAGGTHAWILTNAHVADPSGEAKPSWGVLCERRGRVVARHPARLVALGAVPEPDLAVLEIDAALPAATLATEDEVQVGDDVVVVGAPFGKALSVSGGMVSQIVAADTPPGGPLAFESMKTDAAIGYGSSGGGVFAVPGGRLVGLVEGYRTARVDVTDKVGFDVPMPGETFLAPLTEVRRFLAQHLGADVPPPARPLEAAAAGAARAPVPAAAMPVAGMR